MNHRTRLGPVAIFLAVVVMVITTMAILTLATSNADRTMAKRFAAVTETRYQLEADGERFMCEAVSAGRGGDGLKGNDQVEITDTGYRFYEELNGYSITVEITEPGADGSFDVLQWKVTKLWNSDDPVNNIWPGL